jgi:hypothetical protein
LKHCADGKIPKKKEGNEIRERRRKGLRMARRRKRDLEREMRL